MVTMNVTMVLIAPALLLLFLLMEKLLVLWARRQYSLVIHVNGTRGKSTVTRMIHALLREQGLEVYGKTTGSAARLLLPDGTERPITRLGPANVREQRNTLIHCALLKKGSQKKALVFECNAIEGELQNISSAYLRPDITIITNARRDHPRELGSPAEAAKIFAGAVPRDSVLISPDRKYISTWEEAAGAKNLVLRMAKPGQGEGDFPENLACLTALGEHLGYSHEAVLKSQSAFRPDTGAFRIYRWEVPGGGTVTFADARAANDTESTAQILHRTYSSGPGIFLFVSREDRSDRTWEFMEFIIKNKKEYPFDHYFCLGPAPLRFFRSLTKAGVPIKVIKKTEYLDKAINSLGDQNPGLPIFIFGAGNIGGQGQLISQWLKGKTR